MDHVKDKQGLADQSVRPGTDANADAMDVIRLRYWQHILNEMLKGKKFKIPIHLAFGHEAAAVGLHRCVGAEDAICLTHRNVAYNLARSGSLDAILEHYRLEPNTARPGLMGSMNLAAVRTSIAYSSSILCNNLPVAAGIAMNRKLAKRAGVVFVVTGDGAMEEGAFWETLVFARSHGLALVIIVENNDYSMSSTIAQRRSDIDLEHVCTGAGLSYHHSQGAVVESAKAAIGAARAKAASGTPACVELDLSTFNQHAGPTPGWPDDPLRIALEDGLVVKNGPEDPVFNIQQMLGSAVFQQLSNQIMRTESSDKYLH